MKEKIIIDMLTQDSVSIIKQNVIDIDGHEYPIGDIHRKAYMNSTNDRQSLKDEIEEPYYSSIMSIWGQEPIKE